MAINVVAGERITVTLTAGSVQIRAAPPGMGLAPVGNPFVVDITGANAGTWSFAIDTGTATFTCSVIPPSNNSDTTAALQNSLDTTSQGILDNNGLPLGNGGGGGSNGATFAPTGLGFAVSRADDGNPLDRRFGAAFAPQGYFAKDNLADRGNGFNFSVDLQQMLSAGAAGESKSQTGALDYGMHGSKDGPDQPRSRFNSWVRGAYTDFDDDKVNADRDGHLWTVIGGISYQLAERTQIGIFSRYRDGEVDSSSLAASLDTEGVGGGAFISTTLASGVRISGAALYEDADSNININGVTGSFDANQTVLEARIDKRITRGRHWLEPAVNLLYVNTDQDDFTDSNGNFVVNRDLTLGRLKYGSQVGTTYRHGQTVIKPFAKIAGIWDFDNEGNIAATTSAVFSSGEHAINLGGGVEVVYGNGMTLKVASDWASYDTDFEAWTIYGGFGAPLPALGLGVPGLVSLNLSSDGEDAAAGARLRIPLGKN
jgi:outer membrane autotransporter protein